MFLKGLNPEQAKAVLHRDGPLLILAGAGSGKTTVLVNRAGELIASGCPAKNLTVLTFTNKAARELKHRVTSKLGKTAQGIWAGTFHSFGLQLLRQYHKAANLPEKFGIIDQTDSQGVLKDLMKNLTVAGRDKFDMDKVLNLVNEFRLLGKFKVPIRDEYHDLAETLLPRYLKRLEHLGAVDFEGLLLQPLELMKAHPDIREKVQAKIQFLMVDEFQDTNATQMKLIDAILGEHRNLCVVGDDDQSIYGFRGAEVHNILDFPKRYKPCEVIRLERNYRSTGDILNLANQVIAQNKHRHGKVLRSESGAESEKPELFRYDSEEIEAESVIRELRAMLKEGHKHSDIAVLYRSNSQASAMETLLRQEQIPYNVSGGTSMFDRKEIKDVLAYLRFALHHSDLPLRRVLNTPSRGIGDTTYERVDAFSKEHKLSFYQALLRWEEAGVQDTQGQHVNEFLMQMKDFPRRILTPEPANGLLAWLTEIGYRKHVYESSAEASSGEKKWNVLEIFARILERSLFKNEVDRDSLADFIDQMELRDSMTEKDDANEVSLMTLHASKGLEYPVVFLIGVEEDLLPHRTLGADIDEERRLFYVGITRAKRKLFLSYCQTRRRYGAPRPVAPSRFLLEVPESLYIKYEAGVRPWSEGEHESRIADFLKTLGK